MTNCLTVVATVFSNTLIFLLQKNMSSFCSAKTTHFSAKISDSVFAIFQDRHFKVTLAEVLNNWTLYGKELKCPKQLG